ncbi:unnamed protein product [Didymodactylos carnosus]|uniref:Uncharacterized protein n=1 Tax=Didymodactylos carnosus TaxID=1234261 RepID=A0A813YP76_9BILA|nr:unnamed protein product [Didymodactylos carnosus]CAF3671872.1 unnamed protein product [Didymodactylos carnosus]
MNAGVQGRVLLVQQQLLQQRQAHPLHQRVQPLRLQLLARLRHQPLVQAHHLQKAHHQQVRAQVPHHLQQAQHQQVRARVPHQQPAPPAQHLLQQHRLRVLQVRRARLLRPQHRQVPQARAGATEKRKKKGKDFEFYYIGSVDENLETTITSIEGVNTSSECLLPEFNRLKQSLSVSTKPDESYTAYKGRRQSTKSTSSGYLSIDLNVSSFLNESLTSFGYGAQKSGVSVARMKKKQLKNSAELFGNSSMIPPITPVHDTIPEVEPIIIRPVTVSKLPREISTRSCSRYIDATADNSAETRPHSIVSQSRVSVHLSESIPSTRNGPNSTVNVYKLKRVKSSSSSSNDHPPNVIETIKLETLQQSTNPSCSETAEKQPAGDGITVSKVLRERTSKIKRPVSPSPSTRTRPKSLQIISENNFSKKEERRASDLQNRKIRSDSAVSVVKVKRVQTTSKSKTHPMIVSDIELDTKQPNIHENTRKSATINNSTSPAEPQIKSAKSSQGKSKSVTVTKISRLNTAKVSDIPTGPIVIEVNTSSENTQADSSTNQITKE